jgi:hypothetical protein
MNIVKWLKRVALVALVSVPMASVYALNVDQTRTMSARVNTTQQTNYYRFTVNFNDPNIGTAQAFGRLLQNTYITHVSCYVTTAFNAGTTNQLYIGTSATTPNEILNPGQANKSVTEATIGYYTVSAAATVPSLGVAVTSGGDVNLYARYRQTGTAATAGQAICAIEYLPNNDM